MLKIQQILGQKLLNEIFFFLYVKKNCLETLAHKKNTHIDTTQNINGNFGEIFY